MDIDVYGKHPKGPIGEYFHNTVWSWRPLWFYCESLASDLIPEDNQGQYNGGWGLLGRQARLLGERLMEEIRTGRCAEYAREFEECHKSLPDETCEQCQGTGIRTDEVGKKLGMPQKPNLHTGGVGWCNGCDGRGRVRPFVTHYSFGVENVRTFAQFLLDCGGFSIC